MMLKGYTRLAGLSLAVATLAVSVVARADTIALTAQQTLAIDGNAPVTTSQSTPTDYAPFVLGSIGSTQSSANGRDRSNLAGAFFGLTTQSQGAGNYGSSGLAAYDDVFTAPGTGHFNFNFDYVGGAIAITADPTTIGGTQTASFGATITERIDGGPAKILYEYLGTMTLTGHGTPTFVETGTSPNPGGATLSQGQGNFSWLLYASSVDLGALIGGQNVDISYTLTSFTSGLGTSCAAAGAPAARPDITVGPGPTLGCATAFAGNGDPTVIDHPPTITPVVATAPEPASLALLGGGGLVLSGALRARRRR